MKIEVRVEDNEDKSKAIDIIDNIANKLSEKGFTGQIDLIDMPSLHCYFKSKEVIE